MSTFVKKIEINKIITLNAYFILWAKKDAPKRHIFRKMLTIACTKQIQI